MKLNVSIMPGTRRRAMNGTGSTASKIDTRVVHAKKNASYLGGAVFAHEGAEAVIRDVKNGILALGHVGNVDVVGGGANVLILAVSEDINADDVRLSVAVLAGLGGTDISNLARTTVDDDVATFTNETRLHGKRGGGTGIGGVDGKVLLLIRHGGKAVTETLENHLQSYTAF